MIIIAAASKKNKTIRLSIILDMSIYELVRTFGNVKILLKPKKANKTIRHHSHVVKKREGLLI